jgi:hypothetical protein
MDNADDPLTCINRRLSLIGDRTREVAAGDIPGLYLHGRGGTLKTTKVKDTLAALKIEYEYRTGVMTQGGLREFLADCAARKVPVIVFDDVAAMLEDKKAVQVLLAALGGQSITYQRQGQPPQTFRYEGGIIFISNEEIPNGKSLAALKTRIRVMDYSPGDDELGALMIDWAKNHDLPKAARGLSREECVEVISFLIDESKKHGTALDLRLANKCYNDYRRWKQGETDNHWKVLVTSEIEQAVIAMKSEAPPKPRSRAERLAEEREIVRQILKESPDSRIEQLKLWHERTTHDDHRFDRRKREVKNGHQ